MKPLRTLESVVEELIVGFQSGEVVLGNAPETVPSSPTVTARSIPADFVRRYAHRQQANDLLKIEQSLKDLLSRIAQVEKPMIRDEVKLEVANPKNRLWLFLGEGAKPSANVLWSSVVRARERGINDVRIMVAPSKNSEELVLQLKNSGITDNIRTTTAAGVTGWLAFRDQTLLCQVHRFTNSNIGAAKYRRRGGKSKRDECFRVEEKSFPEDFHNLERFYESLWRSGRTPR
jgi:hypothetical protein